MDNTTYQPGDVANGHRLTDDGQWVPVEEAAPVEAAKPKRRDRKIVLAGVGTVATFAVIAACTSTGGGSDSTKSVVENAPAASAPAAEAPAESAPAEEAPAESGIAAIGEAFTWEDGLTVIVSSIDAVRLNENAVIMQPVDAQVVTLQVQNNTGEAFDAGVVAVTTGLSFGAAGVPAQHEILIEDEGYEHPGSVAPGGTATMKLAFTGVTDPSTMTVSVEPGFMRDAAFWTK